MTDTSVMTSRDIGLSACRGAYGDMFVKGDAFGVGYVAVVLNTGSELAALPFQGADESRISSAGNGYLLASFQELRF